jgi:Flp pilus assembly protein CpaB
MDPTGKEVKQVSMMPLFQNVLVLAIGQDLGGISMEAGSRYKKEEPKAPSPIVTLALSPQEASLIAFVQEQGKIRLILRSPADSQITSVAPANWDTLLMYLTPQGPPVPPAREEPPKKTVEIYRGLEKEIMPLTR